MGTGDVYGPVDELWASPAALDALAARVMAVVGAVSDGVGGMRSVLEELEQALTAAHADVRRRIAMFFLVAGGRLLTDEEVSRLAFEYAEGSRAGSLIALLATARRRRPRLLEEAAGVELVPAGRERLLVDVTHTEHWPTMSGVQRVVRRVCEELRAAGAPFQLIRFDPARGVFVLLDERETAAFYAFRSAPPAERARGRNQLRSILRAVTDATHRVASFVLRDLLPERIGGPLWRGLRSIYRSLRGRSGPPAPSAVRAVLPRGAYVVLLEVVYERERVDAYLSLKHHFDVRLGMVCYDLIPLYQPEYSVVSAAFLDYLRLLQVADRLSCISEFTRERFSGLIAQVERTTEALPELAAHPLAGDLGPGTGAPTPLVEDDPLVLCVGTIEERKNQVGVLRAARLLRARGRRARFAFAGNFGLGHEQFLAEVEEAEREGVAVEIHRGPRDAELAVLYARSYCTVFCSFVEGFGLPIIESMAFGRPCVASDVGSMAEIAAGGGCLRADPRSPETIADALDRLLGDPALHARLVKEITARAPRTWARYTSELVDFFRADTLPGAKATGLVHADVQRVRPAREVGEREPRQGTE